MEVLSDKSFGLIEVSEEDDPLEITEAKDYLCINSRSSKGVVHHDSQSKRCGFCRSTRRLLASISAYFKNAMVSEFCSSRISLRIEASGIGTEQLFRAGLWETGVTMELTKKPDALLICSSWLPNIVLRENAC